MWLTNASRYSPITVQVHIFSADVVTVCPCESEIWTSFNLHIDFDGVSKSGTATCPKQMTIKKQVFENHNVTEVQILHREGFFFSSDTKTKKDGWEMKGKKAANHFPFCPAQIKCESHVMSRRGLAWKDTAHFGATMQQALMHN